MYENFDRLGQKKKKNFFRKKISKKKKILKKKKKKKKKKKLALSLGWYQTKGPETNLFFFLA